MTFLARNCVQRGGGDCQGQCRYAVDHGRALTVTPTKHKSGHYEEGTNDPAPIEFSGRSAQRFP